VRPNVEAPAGAASDDVAVGLDRELAPVEGADLDVPRIDAARARPKVERPASRLDREPRRWTRVHVQGHDARVDPRAGVDPQPSSVERRRPDDEELEGPTVGEPAVGADLDGEAVPEVRQRPDARGRPAPKATRAPLGIAPRHDRVPADAGEQGQASVDGDEVQRSRICPDQDADERRWILRQPEQVRGGVPEARGDVAEREAGPAARDVVGDAERPVATGDDGRGVRVDPGGQPRGQLTGVTGRGDVEVGVERATSQLDRPPRAVGARAAGPLVEEDGSACGYYGSASRISATRSSGPVIQYTVSSLV
jgi:hypothetical protein